MNEALDKIKQRHTRLLEAEGKGLLYSADVIEEVAYAALVDVSWLLDRLERGFPILNNSHEIRYIAGAPINAGQSMMLVTKTCKVVPAIPGDGIFLGVTAKRDYAIGDTIVVPVIPPDDNREATWAE